MLPIITLGNYFLEKLHYLRESADVALDNPEQSLRDWEFLEHRLDSSSMRFYLDLLHRLRSWSFPYLGEFVRNFVRNRVVIRMAFIQESAAEFIYAREDVDEFEPLHSEKLPKRSVKKTSCNCARFFAPCIEIWIGPTFRFRSRQGERAGNFSSTRSALSTISSKVVHSQVIYWLHK